MDAESEEEEKIHLSKLDIALKQESKLLSMALDRKRRQLDSVKNSLPEVLGSAIDNVLKQLE